jgi:hypothetical protein
MGAISIHIDASSSSGLILMRYGVCQMAYWDAQETKAHKHSPVAHQEVSNHALEYVEAA